MRYIKGMKPAVLFVMLLCAASCARASDDKAQPKLTVRELVISGASGTSIVNAELAVTDDEKMRGLMFRKRLADGEGMLFIWDTDKVLSFWMKNTIVPLSIAYIDRSGVIAEIHDMKSGQLNPVQSSRSLRYALEVPQGWFLRSGIKTGDTVDLSVLNPDKAR